jgi:N-acetylglucosaminyl-diphospho-decaprenol L-rhamnosyltransferase
VSVAKVRAVTIVIVSYKTAVLTIDCLRSLLPEREAPRISLRAVVVDNASGDAPAIASAIAREGWDSWVTLVEAPRNGGFAYGNNLGFARAYKDRSPDYLHMLNPDTRVKEGAVGALVEFLETHPQAGIAGSSFENGDGSDWPIAFRFPSAISEFEGGLQLGLVSRLLRPWMVVRIMTPQAQTIDWGAGASMMIRRSVLDRIGGLDEQFFLYFEETEFCWRAKRAGFPMWYVPHSRVVHIGGQSTKVTERNAAPKRLPAYWFESRRRYFMTTASFSHALLIDLMAVIGSALGAIKLILQGRQDRRVPHYVADLWRHSVIHRRNRSIPAARTQLSCSP